ncbi:hypothetical protein [Streptomyces sp. NPDC003015]
MGVVSIDPDPDPDPDTVREWLTWTSAGIEGVLFKRLDDPYRPSRGWQKYKVHETTEAIVGAVTGSLTAPRGLLLGRYDDHGLLQYIGRTTTLTRAASAAVAGQLASAQHGHPWTGWSFSAGWGSRETPLDVTLVEPELVVEVSVDVAREPHFPRTRPGGPAAHACALLARGDRGEHKRLYSR